MTQALADMIGRRRAGLAVSVVVFGIVVACVVAYLMWWSRPSAFDLPGNRLATTEKVDDLPTWNIDVGDAVSDETVTLRGVKAVVVENTADADIEFVICRWRPGLDARLGTDTGSLDEYCASTTPASDRSLNLDATDPLAESIILRVTPKQVGRVELHGVNVDYRRGWRHLWQTGTERTGPDVAITVK